MVKISDKYIHSSGDPKSNLWVVLEFPSEDDEKSGIPASGSQGLLLDNALNNYGLARENIYITYISHHRPYANNFHLLKDSPKFHDDTADLIQALDKYNPNAILSLGDNALDVLTDMTSLQRHRGYIFECVLSPKSKVIPSFALYSVLINPISYPTFDQDVAKAILQSKTQGLPKQDWDIIINPGGTELYKAQEEIIESHNSVASDIESIKGTTDIICVGYAPTIDKAYVFSTDKSENLKVISTINESKARKTFHYGTFDRIMQKVAGYPVANCDFDTYTAQRILNPDLPATLEYLTAAYTDMDYYKQEGRGTVPEDSKVWSSKADKKPLYIYNGKDCIGTARIAQAQRAELEERNMLSLFSDSMEMMEMAIHMSHRGLTVDIERLELFKKALLKQWDYLQTIVDAFCGGHINVRSTPVMRRLLYTDMKLPKRYKNKKLSVDENAIISLITHLNGKIQTVKTAKLKQELEIKLRVLKVILKIRTARQFYASYANVDLCDGKIKSTFVVNKTETGRWAASKYVDGTGLNAMTFPRDSIEIPDNLDAPIDFAKLIAEVGEGEDDD